MIDLPADFKNILSTKSAGWTWSIIHKTSAHSVISTAALILCIILAIFFYRKVIAYREWRMDDCKLDLVVQISEGLR